MSSLPILSILQKYYKSENNPRFTESVYFRQGARLCHETLNFVTVSPPRHKTGAKVRKILSHGRYARAAGGTLHRHKLTHVIIGGLENFNKWYPVEVRIIKIHTRYRIQDTYKESQITRLKQTQTIQHFLSFDFKPLNVLVSSFRLLSFSLSRPQSLKCSFLMAKLAGLFSS